MSIRIVDNKKLDLTNDEHQMYTQLCRSYDRPNFKGEELFKEHFEANNDGIILFVKPPSKRYSSLEVYCFLVSIMVNQHLRLVHQQTDALVKETKAKLEELIKEYKQNKSSVES